jgi:tetratricopeptide (TPR) repeat protein
MPMTTFQGVLFVALMAMVLAWFYCIHLLKLQLLQRHPETHEEMELSDFWSAMRSGERLGPVYALLGFLLRRKYLRLDDPGITRLSVFMRWFMVIYIAMFGCLLYTVLRPAPGVEGVAEGAPAAASSPEDRRQAAYDLHRELKWREAIVAYDMLIREEGEDAEILFWRGMAWWKSAHFDAALRDFQRVIELEPAHLDAHRNADLLLARQQRWDDIIAMWDRYLTHQPRDAEAYFERGGTHFHKGDMAAARADATRACELGKAQACKMVERLKNR